MIGSELTENEKLLDQFFSDVFQSKEVIKIGMGPTNDLKRLAWSYSWLPSLNKFSGVMDISLLAKKGNLILFLFILLCLLICTFLNFNLLLLLSVLIHHQFKFAIIYTIGYPDLPKIEIEGINKLSIKQLGLPVDKSMQCSDWSVRPLSHEQVMYAGMDAWILTQLFDSLLLLSDISMKNDMKKTVKSLCK